MAGASRRWGVVAAVFAIVTVATAGFVIAGQPTDQPEPTRTQARVAPGNQSENQVPAQPSDAIAGLLDARAEALLKGDRQGWLAPLLGEQKSFVTRQSNLFDRIRVVRPRLWRYQVAGGTALPAARREELGGRAWLAEVQLGYRLTDTRQVTTRQEYLTVVRTDEGWRIAADTDGPTARDVWDQGPVVRVAGERCVVIGAQRRRPQVEQLAGECDADAERVDRAWGTTWARRTVLVVPATTKDLGALLDDQGSGLDDTAAVTTGPADGAAEGVLINGEAFDQLSALGRKVVVTHELVHVAVRSTGARYAPTWLSEGFADHVAYEGTGLSAQQIAGGAIDAVREKGIPKNLPTDADFDAADQKNAEAAYDESWVAVGLIARRTDLKRFYERAATRRNHVDQALAQTGLSGFTRLWQAELRRLAD